MRWWTLLKQRVNLTWVALAAAVMAFLTVVKGCGGGDDRDAHGPSEAALEDDLHDQIDDTHDARGDQSREQRYQRARAILEAARRRRGG